MADELGEQTELRDVLLENAKEYFKNAAGAAKRKEYNSSVTLFFKSLSALCDLYILINEGVMPSNHAERFRILETKYPKLYRILDKNFSFYQDSYRSKLNEETSSMLKEDARELFKILNIRI